MGDGEWSNRDGSGGEYGRHGWEYIDAIMWGNDGAVAEGEGRGGGG